MSKGNSDDAPVGREVISTATLPKSSTHLLMDKAYEDETTRKVVVETGLVPVVPPKCNRKCPWVYDKLLYKRRNEVERYFRRLKSYRRIFTRYDKLDTMFLAFIQLAAIYELLKIT